MIEIRGEWTEVRHGLRLDRFEFDVDCGEFISADDTGAMPMQGSIECKVSG